MRSAAASLELVAASSLAILIPAVHSSPCRASLTPTAAPVSPVSRPLPPAPRMVSLANRPALAVLEYSVAQRLHLALPPACAGTRLALTEKALRVMLSPQH